VKKSHLEKWYLLNKFFSKKILIILLALVLLLLSFGLYLSFDRSTITEQDVGGPKTINGIMVDQELDAKLERNSIEFWYQFLDFDPKSGSLSVNAFIWPSSDLAQLFSSSGTTRAPISAFIDNLSTQTSYEFISGDSIGAIPIVIDGTNPLGLQHSNEFYYPFDQYSLDTYAKLKNGSTDSKIAINNSNTYEFFWPSQISGYVFDVWRGATFADTYDWFDSEAYEREKISEQRKNGEISLLIKVSRSNAVKLASILIYFGIVLSCVALCIITVYIYRGKRPPSVTALVWAAAQILGLFQIRQLLPDNPRLGIALDLYLFYPGVISSLLCALILAVFWVKKDDFRI
jgi:hypothetical protein